MATKTRLADAETRLLGFEFVKAKHVGFCWFPRRLTRQALTIPLELASPVGREDAHGRR